jgi:hypothetical protein
MLGSVGHHLQNDPIARVGGMNMLPHGLLQLSGQVVSRVSLANRSDARIVQREDKH